MVHPKSSAPASASTGESAGKSQYHHYIPRFILRRYKVDLPAQGPIASANKKNKNRKKLQYDPNSECVLLYDISTNTLDTRPIGKVYGVQNLYRDVSVEDINELEKGLSVLENHAARVISDLHKALQTGFFTTKCREVNLLRKFLFIMHNRSDLLSSKTHFQEDYPDNGPLRHWLKSFWLGVCVVDVQIYWMQVNPSIHAL